MGYTGEQKNEYQRKWIAVRRAEYFQDKVCVICGSEERLELDHVLPENKISSTFWGWCESRRLEEIAKCQVLCYICHKKKTKEWQFSKVVHGGGTMYSRYGCRCDLCVSERSKRKNAHRTWRLSQGLTRD